MIGSEADGVSGTPVAAPTMRRRTELAEFIARFDGDDAPLPVNRGDDELLRGKKIAVVTNLPTHYRVPLFNQMSERLSRVGASLHVLFTASDHGVKPWMRPEALQSESTRLHSGRMPASKDAPVDLRTGAQAGRSRPHPGRRISPLVAGRVARYAKSRRRPFGIWSGEIPWHETATGGLRQRQRLWLVRQATFGIAYGFAAAEYLHGLAPDLPVVVGRNTTLPALRRATAITMETPSRS